MTPRADFEEKEYEGAANGELALGGFVWSSGQVLEQVIGFDAVAAPVARHVVWRVLRVPRPPGVRLLPTLWQAGRHPPGARLPSVPVSLILQYKRPEYLHGHRAAQWRYWRQPYFRFTRTESQHRVLRRLDRRLEGHAVVRYASPAFWQFADLEAAIVTGEVLSRTGFVRPVLLGPHRTWTYILPGTAGRANPSGRRVAFNTLSEILGALTADAARSPTPVEQPGEALRRHLATVAEAARLGEPTLRRHVSDWVARLRGRDLLLSSEGITQLGDIATIASLVHRAGAAWHIADADEPILPDEPGPL